jgi:hypothetical protein
VPGGTAISRAERSAAAIDSKNASAWPTTLPLRSPRFGGALEHVEGLVVDDRLRDRKARCGDRKLEHRALLAVGCSRQRHGCE